MENLTKAELYLDLLGNCQNRQITADYIHQKSSVLSEMITDFEYCQNQRLLFNLLTFLIIAIKKKNTQKLSVSVS